MQNLIGTAERVRNLQEQFNVANDLSVRRLQADCYARVGHDAAPSSRSTNRT
jgi:predicted metalloprotease